MNINLFPFAVVWMILAAVVVGLIVYRAWIAWNEDDTLHLHQGDTGLVSQQAVTAHKLEGVDRWGQSLTVIALLYGLAVAGVYMYQAYRASEISLR